MVAPAPTPTDRSDSIASPRETVWLNPADLSPASFGIAMATGILSLGAHMFGLTLLSRALFGLNLIVLATLSVLTAWRLWRHPRRCFADLVDHRRGPGYFTTVAGCAIVGSECLLIGGAPQAALALFGISSGLWLLLTYAIFAAFTIKADKPTLADGIGGGWLLAVVATQSLAVLAALLAPTVGPPARSALNFFALAMWLAAGSLYTWIVSLIFYRYTFFPLRPSDLTPPYWINMGAMAISTLAGALLVLHAGDAPLLGALLPFLKGFTLLYWACGTWWIPLLLVLGTWRYLFARHPLRYDPQYWSVVFPLGMYAVATHEMGGALQTGVIDFLPPLFFAAALGAWVSVAAGLVASLLGRTRAAPPG